MEIYVLIGDIPVVADKEEAASVAPGKEKRPISLSNNSFGEDLYHPYFFPTEQVGYNAKRDINLIASKYFNEQLFAHEFYKEYN